MLSLLMVEHAEQVECIGVFLLSREDLLVKLRSRLELAGLMHGERTGQRVMHEQDPQPKP
jgi:hypothetical protein